MESDANIVIQFSEPMNQAAAQAAYQSTDIPSGSVVFTWNAAGDELTINPNADLTYAEGTDPAQLAANAYTIQLTTTATDLAGNPLAVAKATQFTTLRRITHSAPLIANLTNEVRADGTVGSACGGNCVGDSGTAANAQYKAFISFNVSALAPGIHTLEQATVTFNQSVLGSPYTDLVGTGGGLLMDHVNTAELSLAAFNASALASLGVIATSNAAVSVEVADELEDDYVNRAARGDRSQYRLSFPLASDFDGAQDIVQVTSPKLTVVYLLP